MLQQTQVGTVLRYWNRWMRALPDISSLARARPSKLHKLWEGLGYYARVRNMQRAAQIIMKEHAGEFPKSFDHVLALPGIGRYTAGAICSIAFNQPKPIVDGNVTRVLARLYGVAGDPRRRETSGRLWAIAEHLVSLAEKPGVLNQALMELGALLCSARQPQCTRCPVMACCIAHQRGQEEKLPERSRRAQTTARRFVAIVAQRRSHVLVRQRPDGVVNAHLWEFPNLEVRQTDSDPDQAARSLLGAKPTALEPLCTVKHSITRYRIRLEAFRATGLPRAYTARGPGRWLPLSQLRRLAFPSAHKKILDALGSGNSAHESQNARHRSWGRPRQTSSSPRRIRVAIWTRRRTHARGWGDEDGTRTSPTPSLDISSELSERR